MDLCIQSSEQKSEKMWSAIQWWWWRRPTMWTKYTAIYNKRQHFKLNDTKNFVAIYSSQMNYNVRDLLRWRVFGICPSRSHMCCKFSDGATKIGDIGTSERKRKPKTYLQWQWEKEERKKQRHFRIEIRHYHHRMFAETPKPTNWNIHTNMRTQHEFDLVSDNVRGFGHFLYICLTFQYRVRASLSFWFTGHLLWGRKDLLLVFRFDIDGEIMLQCAFVCVWVCMFNCAKVFGQPLHSIKHNKCLCYEMLFVSMNGSCACVCADLILTYLYAIWLKANM